MNMASARRAFERVRDMYDQLGRPMSRADWIAFLGLIEDDVVIKRQAAEAEMNGDEDGNGNESEGDK